MLIDAFVLEEPLVLGRHKRVLNVLGDVGENDPDAPLVFLEYLREAVALAIEHDTRAGQLQAFQLMVIRQIGSRLVINGDDFAKIDSGTLDRFFLAELPISDLQVRKVDAAKRLALTDRLRVIERRRQQFVDIDAFEIEKLQHLAAALVQELGNHWLITVLVEFGLHRIGRGGHLAECQASRENLDENGFHGDCPVGPRICRDVRSGYLILPTSIVRSVDVQFRAVFSSSTPPSWIIFRWLRGPMSSATIVERTSICADEHRASCWRENRLKKCAEAALTTY